MVIIFRPVYIILSSFNLKFALTCFVFHQLLFLFSVFLNYFLDIFHIDDMVIKMFTLTCYFIGATFTFCK